MFGLAVRYGAATSNPVRDVGTIRMASKPARALTEDELRGVIDALRNSAVVLNPANKVTPKQTISQYCTQADLTDVVIMFAATGARISEVLGIRWADTDLTAKTVTITGKVNRMPGGGMIRESFTKTKSGARTLPLPDFAINMLMSRQVAAASNIYDAVFPGQTGMLRDPSAVSKQWRRVRTKLKLDWVTSHTFRKTVATLIDAQGLCTYRGRPVGPRSGIDDSGRVHGAKRSPHRGSSRLGLDPSGQLNSKGPRLIPEASWSTYADVSARSDDRMVLSVPTVTDKKPLILG